MSMIADKTTEGGGRLTVYRASAGSGKTFRLTTEYIKLLLRNPYEFQRTLAVTFTNKATEEMKTRLLSTLYGLGHGLPSAESYRRLLCKETGMTAAAIDAGAAMALEAIMRHYNDFKVETIDSFFQRIVRNLARELGLNAG